MSRSLEELVNDLAAFDIVDLAAGIGGLQLVPSNAERQLRLDLAASIVASLPPGDARPTMSVSRWKQLLNEPPIGDWAQGEDPAEDVFTASLSFTGGPAIVFPGIVTESVEISRRLLEAAFLFPGMPEEYRAEMHPLSYAILRLSNAVAKRAGLARGILPASTPDGQVEVPPAPRFARLKVAVTFTPEDLSAVIGDISPEVLNPLVIDAGKLGPYDDSQGMGNDRMYSRPLLRVKEQLLVVLPSGLLVALRHRLITRALDLGLEATLARNYLLSVEKEVEKCLTSMRFEQLTAELGEEPAWAHETLWTFDVDKVAHILVTIDDFVGYQASEVFGYWKLDWKDQIENRLLRVRELIRSGAEQLEGILQIIVVQGVGRMFSLGLRKELSEPGARVLFMSQADLALIARKEAGDPLALWKFSKAGDRLRERSRVMSLSVLDEYALYQANRHNFYFSDRESPDLINITPGSAARIRHEDVIQFDYHGAPIWRGQKIAEVRRLYPRSCVPIYVREPSSPGRSLGRIEILVEDLALQVWVFQRPAETRSSDLLCFEICEAIAYWVWQISPSISDLATVAAAYVRQIGIEVTLQESENWAWCTGETNTGDWLEAVALGDGIVSLKVGSGAARAFLGADNAGERQLVFGLLKALQDAVEGLAGIQIELDLPGIVDRHAPLGLKKKIISVEGLTNIELMPGLLPPVRLVQDADVAFLSDDLGPRVSSALQLQPGPISSERRVEVLNEIVGALFSQLEATIADLSPEGLLEKFMAQHESLVRESAMDRVVIPTRLACFGTEGDYIEKVTEKAREIIRANLANRFLIEYIAARPPYGMRKLSLDTFDQLMALASEIIDRGMLSDSIRYELANVSLSMLPSGRLGIDREVGYMVGMEEFRKVKSREDIDTAKDRFDRHWSERKLTEEDETPALVTELDRAVNAEFGFTMGEMVHLIFEAETIGFDSRSEPAVMPLDEAVKALQQATNLEPTKIHSVFEALALRARKEFILRGQAHEIYPWRFSRELSYVRRPFVIRVANGREEILWGIRHLEVCRINFLNLIYSGRLKAQSIEMKRFIGDMRTKESEAFNDQVADFLQEQEGVIVRRRVKKIGSLRIEDVKGEQLGDVDVLVANPRRRRVFALETKDFELARTPFELANEVAKLLSGDNSAVAHHQKRVHWLRRHIPEVCKWLSVPEGRGKWRVEALIVVSQRLLSPYIQRSPIRVVTLEELSSSGLG